MNKNATQTEMIKVARARKYREDEGFLDNAVRIDFELEKPEADYWRRKAKKLAAASGVSFDTAWNAMIEQIVINALRNRLIAQRN
ncbi:MAG: hypothetical protein PHY43_14850 [Verrucomicrobiales bacterium]|nr:hypothetical protein [Verrucomicrobiales bacterium]